MDDLAMSLKEMCEHNRDGSRTAQSQRAWGLSMLSHELARMGFKLPHARSLKGKHVRALITQWQVKGLSQGTIKNRMSWIRWWADKTGKFGMLPRDNADLGIAEKTMWKGQHAATTAKEKLEQLPERMQLAIKLQMAFGLRLEESLKIRVAEADKDNCLVMQPSWCKGGRARTIPLTHPRQRDLLDEVHRVCGEGSLIPEHMSYITFRKGMEAATLKAGITHMHKHRHWYATWRYKTLFGEAAPSVGGRSHLEMTPEERDRSDTVRLEISRELGHNRIDVTDAYLGPRWAKKR